MGHIFDQHVTCLIEERLNDLERSLNKHSETWKWMIYRLSLTDLIKDNVFGWKSGIDIIIMEKMVNKSVGCEMVEKKICQAVIVISESFICNCFYFVIEHGIIMNIFAEFSDLSLDLLSERRQFAWTSEIFADHQFDRIQSAFKILHLFLMLFIPLWVEVILYVC